jgi:hypothetical protein
VIDETLIARIVYLLKRAKIEKPSHLTHAFTFGITFDLFDDVFDVFDGILISNDYTISIDCQLNFQRILNQQ